MQFYLLSRNNDPLNNDKSLKHNQKMLTVATRTSGVQITYLNKSLLDVMVSQHIPHWDLNLTRIMLNFGLSTWLGYKLRLK